MLYEVITREAHARPRGGLTEQFTVSALAIEINDAGLVVADAGEVLAVEPGFALVVREGVVTGSDARAQARLYPRRVSNRYWSDLSLEPASAGGDVDKNAAELAFAQLSGLWERNNFV